MEEKEYTIDLMEIARVIFKNSKSIAKITAGFIALAVLYLLIATPIYESTALLQISAQKGLGGSLLDSMVGGGSGNQQDLNNSAEILKSRSVVIPVIEATEEPNEEGKYPEYEEYVEKKISTSPYRNTNILQVAVKADDPEKAQKVNELLINGLLNRTVELNRDAQTKTKGFLEERVKQAKIDLEIAENALDEYKANNHVISPSDTAKAFSDRISDAQKQAVANDIALKTAEANLAMVNGQLGEGAAYISDNRIVQQYRSELARAEAERISYIGKYTDKHPKMIDVNDRIKNLQLKIQEEIDKVASLQVPSDNAVQQNLIASKFRSESEIVVAREKAAALQKIIDENNAELEKLPALERGYVRVARDNQVANEIYIMLAKRLEEAKVAEVMQPNNVQVLDKPMLPEKPIRPRKALSLLLAAILGFLCSSGYYVGNSLLNKVISTEDDVREYLGLSVIGSIPDEAGLSEAMAKLEDNTANGGILSKVKEFLWKK